MLYFIIVDSKPFCYVHAVLTLFNSKYIVCYYSQVSVQTTLCSDLSVMLTRSTAVTASQVFQKVLLILV